eukprot:3504672-Rhodomonas_salina.1
MADAEATESTVTQAPLLSGSKSQQLHDDNAYGVSLTHSPLTKENDSSSSSKDEHHYVETPATPSAA